MADNRNEEQAVVFYLREQTYGIDIDSVLEIIRMESIVQVPGTPHFIEGIINLRGRIVPVMDLARWFGLEASEITSSSRIIIVEAGESTVGMIVDSVSEVLRFPVSCIEPPPPMIGNMEFIRGVALFDQRMIILLELARVLREEEKTALDQLDMNALKSYV
ncbi:CheW protein [Desulfocucumis palustris]|uniref:CheW protein n=1 Tax=Desulfocucumis palustris TaxID=1898651 RepID=A0A2L2X7Y2_9FIRM|nr:chemotaxis protein CheW [Desulfocucumis palustris]GBF32275.1 CheW protein [Desulfocucumis palustris]